MHQSKTEKKEKTQPGKFFKEHLINKKVRRKISKEEIISLTIIFKKKKRYGRQVKIQWQLSKKESE